MKQVSKWLIIPALALALATAACGGDTSQAAAPDTSNANITVVGQNNSGLVARVNGEGITVEQFQRAVARAQQESTITDPAALQRQTLDTLIEQTLIRQAATDLQISVTDDEVQAELQTNIDLAGGADKWDKWLAENLYTEDEFRDALRNSLLTQKVVARITDDLSGDVPQVHARHILVHTEQEAQDILTQLQNGADFSTLAMTYSVAADAQFGGDLGWFTHQGLLEQSLADVAFSLQPGQIAGPVATRLGYHIIQTLEFATKPVDAETRVNLAEIQFENWLDGLRSRATIERY